DLHDPPDVGVGPAAVPAVVQQALVGGRRQRGVGPGEVPAHASHLRSRSSVSSMSAYGTRSSCLCANSGSPGPKLTAGTPSALNRETSVQPNLGLTSPPTASTNAAAAGTDRPGSAPGATSVTVTSKPAKTSRTWASASAGVRSGANR